MCCIEYSQSMTVIYVFEGFILITNITSGHTSIINNDNTFYLTRKHIIYLYIDDNCILWGVTSAGTLHQFIDENDSHVPLHHYYGCITFH